MGAVARRRFLISAAALLAAPRARAQQSGKVYRVAIVLTTSPLAEMAGPNPVHPLTRIILHELGALGYVEGRNLIFERRSAEGDPKRYAGIVDDLIALKTDVIILSGDRYLIRAAYAATRTIPLVLMSYPRAVEDGYAASLGRPGGNVTGLSFVPSLEVASKSMQLFKEAVPKLSRVAFLAPIQVEKAVRQPALKAARELEVAVVPVEQHPTDPQASFAAITQAQVDGVFVMASSTAYAQREHLGRLAVQARLPGMFPYTRMVETGGLMSYATNQREYLRRVPHYVDRILKGAYPGDLPMESPTQFDLVINLKTARALGLEIPQSILLRADRVIE